MFEKINIRSRRLWTWLTFLSIPYFILIFLQVINPFLSKASYCPKPSFLENTIWIFPSPVTEWTTYAYGFLILYVIVLIIRRSIIASKNQSNDGIVVGPSVFKIIAPLFWLILGTLVIGFLIAAVESSNSQFYFVYFINNFLSYVNGIMVPIVFLSVIVFFLVGAYEYFIPGLDGNMIARRSGRIRMFCSFLIAFVFIVFWAVVNLFTNSLGLSGGIESYELPSAPIAAKDTIGFSVGGAKDADNFRENIERCYLPVPTDITYEGLFYDYTFDTKNQTGCTSLFCPQYEAAILPDPFSGKDEYFLSVGLASNIDASTFRRPPLDLVVVIDISGSMSSSFDRYYYDKSRDPNGEQKDADWKATKMEVAKEALGAMVDRLHPDDRFGLVIFDSTAETSLEPFELGQNGYAKAKNAFSLLQPRGGTNMEAGLEEGTRLIKTLTQNEEVDRERRIIFLTDAMPNTGAIEQNELYKIGQRNATEGIHTTFIGVGVDFNTELVEALTKKIPGANYYSIHSSTDFEKRLDIEFEYMVAPLVYDLALTIEGGDYEIRAVYGSPEAHLSTGEVLKVSTLFPSPTKEGNSRGGIILAHMKKVRDTGIPSRVIASYTDRSGEYHVAQDSIKWSDLSGTEASRNMRKAVLLSRYVNLVQNWLIDENDRQGKPEKTIYVPIQPYYTFYSNGLVIPSERYLEGNYTPYELNYWERLSRELVVSNDYKAVFKDFRQHMEKEVGELSEQENLNQEIKLLENLENSPDSDYVMDENSDSIGRELNKR